MHEVRRRGLVVGIDGEIIIYTERSVDVVLLDQ